MMGQRSSVSRRSVLGLLGGMAVIGFSGCLGNGDPVETTMTLIARDDDSEEVLWEDDEATIEWGSVHWWEFTLSWEHEIEYSMDVLEGEAVDVFIIDTDQLDPLLDGDGYEAHVSHMDVDSVEETTTLDEGEYYFVIANADIEAPN